MNTIFYAHRVLQQTYSDLCIIQLFDYLFDRLETDFNPGKKVGPFAFNKIKYINEI